MGNSGKMMMVVMIGGVSCVCIVALAVLAFLFRDQIAGLFGTGSPPSPPPPPPGAPMPAPKYSSFICTNSNQVMGSNKTANMCCDINKDITDPKNCVKATKIDNPIFYQNINYGGESWSVTTGSYSEMKSKWNDKVSSIRIPPGWKVTAFQHAFRRGDKQEYTEDQSSLGGFNDTISSFEVSKV